MASRDISDLAKHLRALGYEVAQTGHALDVRTGFDRWLSVEQRGDAWRVGRRTFPVLVGLPSWDLRETAAAMNRLWVGFMLVAVFMSFLQPSKLMHFLLLITFPSAVVLPFHARVQAFETALGHVVSQAEKWNIPLEDGNQGGAR